MTYRVEWRRSVLQLLHTYTFMAYETGGDTAALDAAVDEIDRLLQTEPHTAGESRGDTERVLIVSPFTVRYEVFDRDQVVLIYALKYRRGR